MWYTHLPVARENTFFAVTLVFLRLFIDIQWSRFLPHYSNDTRYSQETRLFQFGLVSSHGFHSTFRDPLSWSTGSKIVCLSVPTCGSTLFLLLRTWNQSFVVGDSQRKSSFTATLKRLCLTHPPLFQNALLYTESISQKGTLREKEDIRLALSPGDWENACLSSLPNLQLHISEEVRWNAWNSWITWKGVRLTQDT